MRHTSGRLLCSFTVARLPDGISVDSWNMFVLLNFGKVTSKPSKPSASHRISDANDLGSLQYHEDTVLEEISSRRHLIDQCGSPDQCSLSLKIARNLDTNISRVQSFCLGRIDFLLLSGHLKRRNSRISARSGLRTQLVKSVKILEQHFE